MNNNQAKGGSFSNGFLWGLIVGAAIVFLLATKKGRRLLKTITEDGFEGLTDLYDLFDEEEVRKTKSSQGVEYDDDEDFGQTKISTKRFFKGIPKKN